MDHSDHRQQFQHQSPSPTAPNQIPYPTPPYQAPSIPSTTMPPVTVSSPQHHPTFPNPHHFQHQQQQLQSFWANQIQEIEQTTDFKNHSLPLARIKKIMKADEDVRMISAEAPVVFAKACEMFILELTLRSWIHTEENKRRTLQKNDITAAISRTDVFDFLVDIIPRDELREEGLGVGKGAVPVVGSPNDGLPYYYVPPPVGAAMYGGQQPRGALPFVPWPQDPSVQGQQQQQQQSDSRLEG